MSANTETPDNDMDNRYGPRNNHYNLRPRHKPTYNNLSLNTVCHESVDELLHYILTQQSVMKRLTIFREPSITAVIDELKKMHS